ncbi:Gfo/Idh/MocA family protein [Flexithrix dorotheae]|uniref:Gfo/Idh/MocA family protein n=1 Tax=Flexithrix dorotheae TaxID=70993 RepID=UPI00036CAA79|nr:Gfo/Idh/MocA family oxidoreductase [Flexithrix dorotheae]
MSTRRAFVKQAGKGIALSSLAVSSPSLLYSDYLGGGETKNKKIQIGIIGAENSHTRGFGKMFNIDKKFPGVEVKYVWGETEAFAKDAMEKGGIPNMVKDPSEMLGKIDALIVDHRHGKYHLPAATPFLEEKIPIFIDKPFCYRLQEGIDFLQKARKLGTPVTSFSSIAQNEETFDIMEQLKDFGEINQVIRSGSVDLNSEYGGVFFYGAHIIQPLMYMFGDDVEKVRIIKNGKNSGASMVFANGMLASLVFTTKKYGWQTFVETENGINELKSRVEPKNPGRNYVDMVEMFRTGKEPRSHKSILSGVAVLEALEKSVSSGQWEKVESFTI